MAVYTIAGTAIDSKIRYRLSEYGSIETFDDTELSSWVEDVVREYSMYRPRYTSFNVTTVVDQKDYTIPVTDLIDVAEHNYKRVASSYFDDIPYTDLLYIPSSGQGPAQYYIDAAQTQMIDRSATGLIERRGNKIRLYPTPEKIETVTVEYLAFHVRTVNDYATVDVNDVGPITDWVTAKCYLALAGDFAKRPTLTEGQTEYDFSDAMRNLRRQAAALEYAAKSAVSIGTMFGRT